jgi:AcrR family transcriptional regulator
VAAAAGVNIATLHLHWKSKAVLYESVCRLHARLLFQFAGENRDTSRGLEDFVEDAIEFLTAHPHIASLALQSVADQTPPEVPSLFRHDVSAFRAMEEMAREEFGGTATELEPMLVVLSVFYFTAVLFCDSPLQRALLGGSVYDDQEVRQRIGRFAKVMVAQLMGAPNADSAPERIKR